jgi:hypothetical protein
VSQRSLEERVVGCCQWTPFFRVVVLLVHAEMMRHMDPSLVGSSTRSQRDEVTFSFSYHFSSMKLLTSLHLIFSGGEQLAVGGGGGGHL